MKALCKWGIRLFAVAYLLALAALLIGMFGLFGQEKDPLSGIFLLPLGWPWVFMVGDAPDPLLPWIGVFAPLLNLTILIAVCRALRDRGNISRPR